MDFMQRGSHQNQVSGQVPGSPTSPTVTHGRGKRGGFAWLPLATVLLLFSATVLVLAIVASIVTSGPKSESKYVDKTKYQAVFLNGGQVYFGKVTNLNDQYLRVADIYYLRVNQQVQPDAKSDQQASNDISLVKLGCELHGPADEMVVNREQVIFWENLKGDGQVAKAVATYKQQNPNGQKCNQPSQSTNTDINKKP